MGVPTSEVGYISAMPRREDHEVHKRTCGGIGKKKLCTIKIEVSKEHKISVVSCFRKLKLKYLN
jgi:hypothetical protein